MDLLITFEKAPKIAIEEVSKLSNQLLSNWIDKIICFPLALDGETNVGFTRENLDDLITDLKAVNTENCHFYFPDWRENYDDKYWNQIKEMKEWTQQMLGGFDFETNRLIFSCSWQ